jgi:glycogen synthase
MAAELRRALQLRASEPEKWQALCNAASAARFLWADSATQYLEKLYRR